MFGSGIVYDIYLLGKELSDINATRLPFLLESASSFRTLMTTSVKLSLLAKGEPEIHPMMYQLYFCVVY